MNNRLVNPVKNGKIRKIDKWGSGQFSAPRGSRKHHGLDITVVSGQDIFPQ